MFKPCQNAILLEITCHGSNDKDVKYIHMGLFARNPFFGVSNPFCAATKTRILKFCIE